MYQKNIFDADLESKAKVRKYVFLNIAKLISNTKYKYSIKSIYDTLEYSYESILDVLLNDFKHCFDFSLKDKTRSKYEYSNIMLALTDDGISLFFKNVTINEL